MSIQKNLNKNKADENRILKPVEDESFYRFEKVGDTINGVYSEQELSEKYNTPLFTIGDKRILGKTQLNRLMKKVNIGEFVEIELIDIQDTTEGHLMIFEVRK